MMKISFYINSFFTVCRMLSCSVQNTRQYSEGVLIVTHRTRWLRLAKKIVRYF